MKLSTDKIQYLIDYNKSTAVQKQPKNTIYYSLIWFNGEFWHGSYFGRQDKKLACQEAQLKSLDNNKIVMVIREDVKEVSFSTANKLRCHLISEPNWDDLDVVAVYCRGKHVELG